MNDKVSKIVEKIAAVQARQVHNTSGIETLQVNEASLQSEREKLDDELKAAKKPKLKMKHLDIAKYKADSGFIMNGIYINKFGTDTFYGIEDDSIASSASMYGEVQAVYGNLEAHLDDLKAIAEEVEYDKEYKFGKNDNLRLLLDGAGSIHFRGDCGFWMKDATPIVRMIQRMMHTHTLRSKE